MGRVRIFKNSYIVLQSWPKLCGTSLLVVRKESLPTSRPALHRGEGGSERILQKFGKKAL